MRFNLNSRWALFTDENQVVIARRQTVLDGENKGREYMQPTYYYGSFEQALDGLVDRDIRSLEKLEQVAGRIAELKKEIRSLLEKTDAGNMLKNVK